eukprot:scaffold58350_cov57-Phaeocystis_antarctica.AAC.2
MPRGRSGYSAGRAQERQQLASQPPAPARAAPPAQPAGRRQAPARGVARLAAPAVAAATQTAPCRRARALGWAAAAPACSVGV